MKKKIIGRKRVRSVIPWKIRGEKLSCEREGLVLTFCVTVEVNQIISSNIFFSLGIIMR